MYEFKQTNQKEKGITLIALIVIIVVLLILASITIGALTSENGIINNAKEAKEKTEIANEKEIVDRATIQAMGNNSRGNLVEDELQEQLDKITDNGKTEVSDVGEEFEVAFMESKRYYTVDKDGNVSEAQEIIEDKSPGDITKDENGNEIEEEQPYEIWCIEDLVVLSNMSRGKGNYIENGEIVDITARNTFSGKSIELMRDLNFNSKYSYGDLTITWSYDETNESYIIDETSTQNLRELLIDKNGAGFIPISATEYSFQGIFDGQNFKIQNLYENGAPLGGLFGNIYGATIKNIKLIDVDITSEGNAGGIIGFGSSENNIYNCYVSGNIKVKEGMTGSIGGIVGSILHKINIINCYNVANIESRGCAGGMIGSANSIDVVVINCCNFGNINSIANSNSQAYNAVGGIGGIVYGNELDIINTVSMGNMNSTRFEHYTFVMNYETARIENCYYLNSIVSEKTVVNEGSIEFSRNDETILENLNKYVEEHKNDYIDEGIELYSWELDSDGLPTFKK